MRAPAIDCRTGVSFGHCALDDPHRGARRRLRPVLFMAPIFAGGKSLGQVQEIGTRLWTGMWKKEDADRLR